MKPLLVLDRDGVLNELIYDTEYGRGPRSISEIKYLPTPTELSILGKEYSLACVTNQPDISKRKLDQETAFNIHDEVMQHFRIRNSFMCTHDNEAKCDCRKPGTLMLSLAKESFTHTGEVTIVGDRWTDILAGNQLGWRTVLLQRDNFTMSKTSQGMPPENLKIDIRVKTWKELIEALTDGDM
jgi:histidinol-phosphate phosphatase family protein